MTRRKNVSSTLKHAYTKQLFPISGHRGLILVRSGRGHGEDDYEGGNVEIGREDCGGRGETGAAAGCHQKKHHGAWHYRKHRSNFSRESKTSSGVSKDESASRPRSQID